MNETHEKSGIGKNGIEKKLGLNGLAVLAALMILYGISCTAVQSWQLYMDDFAGIIELLLLSLAISALWLGMYWYLDRVRRESIKMTLLSFLLGASAYITCRTGIGWIAGKGSFPLMENVCIPVFSFFVIFVSIVLRFPSFDELVDSFIYGAFVGTGIAFAACMTAFTRYASLDGQFVIIELITRISVYAAICALTGFLLHQSLIKRRGPGVAASPALMAVLLYLDFIIENHFLGQVATAGFTLIPVLISAAFAVLLLAVVILLIHRILGKGEADVASMTVPRSRAISLGIAVLSVLLAISALGIRVRQFQTRKFVSPDGNWTFRLPANFSATEETVQGSIFSFDASESRTFYTNDSASIKLYVFSDTEPEFGNPSDIRSAYGWQVSSQTVPFVSEDSYAQPCIMYQTSLYMQKEGTEDGRTLLVDVFSSRKNDAELARTLRVFMKTVEARND